MILTFYIILLTILILFSAFFSSSETALFSLSDVQKKNLSKKNPAKGKLVSELLEKPRTLLITILLGNEFVNIAISSVTAGIIIMIFHKETLWINILIALPILLLFGEITPKTIAINNNIALSSFIVKPLILFGKIITPLRWIIKHIADRIVNLIIRKKSRKMNILTEDIVKTIVNESQKEGELDLSEKESIHKIFNFGDTQLSEIFTPRSTLFCLPESMSLKSMILEIKQGHYSSVPIYRKNQDNIIGILFATDLIGLTKKETENSSETLSKIIRKPYFVPENKRADILFAKFKKERLSVAITLDEYGGVTGLVTIEDLLENIFGEIYDEFEIEESQFKKIGENIYKIDASINLEEFNTQFSTNLSVEGMESLGGFVFSLFGEIPKNKATIKYQNLQFTVDKIENNRIQSIILRRK